MRCILALLVVALAVDSIDEFRSKNQLSKSSLPISICNLEVQPVLIRAINRLKKGLKKDHINQ